jgi:hypothetical protein
MLAGRCSNVDSADEFGELDGAARAIGSRPWSMKS